MYHLENVYFIRPNFLRKAELTNLDESVEQRKSILHNSPNSLRTQVSVKQDLSYTVRSCGITLSDRSYMW